MAGKNPIGWFEIYVKDFDVAKKFYGSIFDWEFKPSQGTKSLYWNIFTGDGSIGGGFMKKESQGHEGHSVLIYVEVGDITETLKKIKENGGKVNTEKTLINETAGSFALFNDTDGNLIGLWSKN
jgi:predicted enzyme related to lactoylglutathione lyase